jgi:hypothetical protein
MFHVASARQHASYFVVSPDDVFEGLVARLVPMAREKVIETNETCGVLATCAHPSLRLARVGVRKLFRPHATVVRCRS